MPYFFTDGSDLNGVRRARDICYVRELGMALSVLGAWPADRREGEATRVDGVRLRRILGLFVLFAFVAPGCYSALWFFRHGDVKKQGHIVLTLLIMVVGVSKAILFFAKIYWAFIDKYLEDINLFNHKHRNTFLQKEHLAVHARCHTLWRSMFMVLVMGVMLYNSQPLYVNIMSGAYSGDPVDYEYSVYYVIPYFDLQRDLGPHIITAIWNIWMCLWAVGLVWLPDLLAMTVVLHIGGHMRVLGQEMENFREDKEKAVNGRSQFNEQESAIVSPILKHFVDRHRQILSYVTVTNEAFSAVYFIYFTYFQVALCIMMWECSQGKEGLIQYGILTISSVFSLSLLCFVMEMISTENDALVRSVYDLPWQLMRVPERRVVFLMLMRVQLPLRMKALGLTDIGVSTMAAILKTSTSYFMFLRSKA